MKKEMLVEKVTKETDAVSFYEKYVDADRFLGCCNSCPNFGKIYSCPPYEFSVEEFWKSFRTMRVILYKVNFPDGTSLKEGMEVYAKAKEELTQFCLDLEKTEPGAVSLAPGSCDICGKGNCARVTGEHCRHPEKMRYSIESLGGDVVGVLRDFFNVEILWAKGEKAPAYMTLVAAILKK